MSAETMGEARRRINQRRRAERLSAIAWPIASFSAFLAAWQFLARPFGIPEYVLPLPSEFLPRFVGDFRLIAQHSLITAQAILLGFLWATIVSVPLGLLIVSVRVVEKAIYPLIVFFQIVPKIAIAPLFVVWFGFGMFPKVLLTFLLCFFPTLVASMTGFRALDERVLYLTRSMGASRAQTFWYVRVPAAMSYIFAGLKVSIVFAVTGAIVGEFVGSNAGIGYLLLRGTSLFDLPLIFACLVALCIVGIVFAYAVDALETLMMPWQRAK